MTELTKNPVLSDSAALLLGYGFDLGGFEVEELVSYWSSYYPPHWLRAAILEALHQGRYKAISVGQILVIWRRRGQPLPHYSYEFERAVSTRFPASRRSSSALAMASPASTALNETPESSHHGQAAIASPDSQQRPPFKQSSESPSSEIQSSEIQSVESADSSGEPQDRSQATPAADPEAIAPACDHRDHPNPHQQSLSLLDPSDLSDPSDPAVHSAPLTAHPDLVLPQAAASTVIAKDAMTAAKLSPAASSTEDEALELWGRSSIMHLPIHQYVPIVPRFETSTFYAKLRAVAIDEIM